MKKNVLWNTVGTVFYFFCQWVLTVLVLHLTGDFEISGYLALAMTTSSSYSTIALFNMRSFQVSDVTGEFSDGIYAGSRIFTCGVSFVCCAVAAALAGNSIFQVLCILAFMGIRMAEAWVDVLHGMDQKYNRYDVIGKSYLLRGTLTVALFVAGIYLTKNLLLTLVLVFVATAAAGLGYDGYCIKKLNPEFKIRMTKQVFVLLGKCVPFVVISYLLSQENLLPKQTLQNLYGADQQGIYSTIAAPALIVQVCSAVVFSPFLPVFSQVYHDHDRKRFQRMLGKLYLAILGGSIVVTLGAVLLGRWGLKLLYGEEILAHYSIFLPVVWVTILTAVTWIFVAILTAMRKMKALLGGMIVDFGICLLLMKPMISAFEKNGVNYVQLLSLGLYVCYMIIVCEVDILKKDEKTEKGRKEYIAAIRKPFEKHVWILPLVKYSFSLILTLIAFSNIPSKKYLLCCLLELCCIGVVSDLLLKNRVLGNIVNAVVLVLYNVQMLVLYFGSSFITLVMVTNLDSLEDLSGNFGVYAVGLIFLIVFTFLPIRRQKTGAKIDLAALSLFLVLELCFTMYFGNAYSPLYAYFDLGMQQYQVTQQRKKMKSKKDRTKEYFQGDIANLRQKPESLPEKPNVVYIMTEGLSQSIVEDERDIMPNVREWEGQSLNFTNYYNHTFATYRGIIGQLYSGYQLENFDENTLVSAQSIFKDLGYHTSFINTEPKNSQFTAYLEGMRFDEVIGDPGKKHHGEINSLSDKEAYETLFDTMLEQHESGNPFFTAIYTFGTHASFDSPDRKFGNGDDAMLNKFHNVDWQFGKFMEKFIDSEMSEDTVIVFTADHATYADKYFNDSFSGYQRLHPGLDRIPLFIYHKRIEPEEIDVSGRNSLDAVPTVMDYLDISEPNYFLGVSLFTAKDNANNYDTIYQAGTEIVSTENGVIGPLPESRMNIFTKGVEHYYTAKLQRVLP